MRRVLATLMTTIVALGACGQAGPSDGQPAGSAAGSTATAAPTMIAAVTPSPGPPLATYPTRPTGAIAFIREQATPAGEDQLDVYLVDVAGGGVTRLTNDSGLESDLYWVTDGSRLVYAWQAPGPEGGYGTYHQTLASVRPDGTDRRDLGSVPTPGYAPPALSPDRRSIVFSGDGSEDGSSGLVLLDLVDGTLRQLTTHGETDAIWSPDGRRILADLPSRGVVIVDAASGEEQARIADPGVVGVLGWTADGLSVIYKRCGPELGKFECIAAPLLAADADGTHVRPYTGPSPAPVSDTSIVSPDGRWVASWANGPLRVTPSSGGAGVQVAPSGPAAWSPDSAWLAFTGSSTEPTASGDAPSWVLFVVHRTGGPAIKLTDGPNDGAAAWRPD